MTAPSTSTTPKEHAVAQDRLRLGRLHAHCRPDHSVAVRRPRCRCAVAAGPRTTGSRSCLMALQLHSADPCDPRHTLTVLLAAATLVAAGCNPIERAARQPRQGSTTERLDTQTSLAAIHRGTVGAECAIVGWDDQSSPTYRPTVVRGYGLVVGLDGTGSGDIPPDVRTHMLQVMGRRGVGSETSGFGHLDPELMLDSQDTAVVIVEAIIPQGATGRKRTPPVSGREAEILPGTTFDVMVTADPRTSTTSLEGGQLYTTEMRPGPLMAGSLQAFALAESSGPLFINPVRRGHLHGQRPTSRCARRAFSTAGKSPRTCP